MKEFPFWRPSSVVLEETHFKDVIPARADAGDEPGCFLCGMFTEILIPMGMENFNGLLTQAFRNRCNAIAGFNTQLSHGKIRTLGSHQRYVGTVQSGNSFKFSFHGFTRQKR